MLTNDLTNVRIIQKRLEAEDVVSLRLRSLDGRPLPGFEAGAHIDIEVAPGVRRQYSLCSASGDAMEYEIAVLREPASRGGSKAVHDVLQVGQVVSISSPRNHFPLDPAATRSLLFAGGIGVTPIMAMAEELAGKESAFEMHYCARTPAKMAYRDRVGAGIFASHARLHFDDGADVQKLDLAAVLADVDPATHIYVCGPAGFINAVLAAAEAQGWPEVSTAEQNPATRRRKSRPLGGASGERREGVARPEFPACGVGDFGEGFSLPFGRGFGRDGSFRRSSRGC